MLAVEGEANSSTSSAAAAAEESAESPVGEEVANVRKVCVHGMARRMA